MRSVRESRHLTPESLAESCGLELRQLLALEEGNEVPALSPLGKVAHALGVRLGTFLDDNESWGPEICRKGQGVKEGGRLARHLHFSSCAPHKPGRSMEPFVVEVDASQPGRLSSHEGEEFLYVLSGSVEIGYGNQTYHLDEGDSIYFDSIVGHRICAPSGKSRLLAVLYAPF